MQKEQIITAADGHLEMPLKSGVEEILARLLATRKALPCKFFYDKTGSKLFEQITRLKEYYLSRCEKSILERHARELMRGTEGSSLVELGSGDFSKISILLQALPTETFRTVTYVPVDVSQSAIEESRCKIKERFGGIEVRGIVADFMQQINFVPQHERGIICFLGSTIGNLDRQEAARFVAELGKLAKKGERLLLGLDMVKDKDVIERAYNDEQDVTARFNKNILNVVNSIIKSDFDPELFRHHAFYDEERQRIEMHLVATRDMTVRSPFFDQDLKIREGETVHTENSHKFTSDHIGEFASVSGLSVRAVYTDSNHWFTLVDYIK